MDVKAIPLSPACLGCSFLEGGLEGVLIGGLVELYTEGVGGGLGSVDHNDSRRSLHALATTSRVS